MSRKDNSAVTWALKQREKSLLATAMKDKRRRERLEVIRQVTERLKPPKVVRFWEPINSRAAKYFSEAIDKALFESLRRQSQEFVAAEHDDLLDCVSFISSWPDDQVRPYRPAQSPR